MNAEYFEVKVTKMMFCKQSFYNSLVGREKPKRTETSLSPVFVNQGVILPIKGDFGRLTTDIRVWSTFADRLILGIFDEKKFFLELMNTPLHEVEIIDIEGVVIRVESNE